MANSKIFYSVILLCTLYIGGFFSFFWGRELGWDLANYHYYIPYAFLHARQGVDFWPTSFLHQYLNPTIDFLTYFLIKYVPSHIAVFTLGAIHSVNFWLLLLIAHQCLPEKNEKGQFLLVLLIAFMGIYGPTSLPGMASFQNDNLVSLFVLSYVFIQLQVLREYFQTQKIAIRKLSVAGFLLGISVGLKLTAGLYVVGAIIAMLFVSMSLRDRMRFILIICLSVTTGIVLSGGYWMWIMWQQHHNPFFPFYNAIFRSPDFPAINWQDARFLPQTLSEKLFYPFYFSWDGRTGDLPYRDFRFIVVYVLFIFAGLIWVGRKIKNKQTYSFNAEITWLFGFFIFSYIVWQHSFSIMRYLVSLEMLAPLIIFLLISWMIKNIKIQLVLMSMIFFMLVVTMHAAVSVRALWYENDFFNVKLPSNVKANQPALVLMAYSAYTPFAGRKQTESEKLSSVHPRPQSYLIPFFPKSWRFVGVPLANGKLVINQHDMDKIRLLVKSYPNGIYLLTADRDMPAFYTAVQQLKLLPSRECEKIKSDRQIITRDNVLLCRVQK